MTVPFGRLELLKLLFDINTDSLQRRLERLCSFQGAEIDGIFDCPQGIQGLMATVDFKSSVMLNEAEAKIASLLVTSNIFATEMDVRIFLVEHNQL